MGARLTLIIRKSCSVEDSNILYFYSAELHLMCFIHDVVQYYFKQMLTNFQCIYWMNFIFYANCDILLSLLCKHILYQNCDIFQYMMQFELIIKLTAFMFTL